MLILGLESSCDETAAAVVEDGRRVVSSVISSQVEIHAPYGGVVPELASRHHVENILPVIQTCLEKAGLKIDDIDVLAATRGPGLVGALLVALSAGKSLALALDKPLVGVDHLKAHIAAAWLEEPVPQPPVAALVVSGGHTSLYRINSLADPPLPLGSTRDDAAGEAFDKVGKLLGLAYPAGPVIDRLAREGRDLLGFPRPMMDGSLDFSFSGLKTAVLNYFNSHPVQRPGEAVEPGQTPLVDVCASFQEAVCDVLAAKTADAARRQDLEQVIMVGGVAANSRLRTAVGNALAAEGRQLITPSPVYCTDNAAMVAAAAFEQYRAGDLAGWDLDAVSRMIYPAPDKAPPGEVR